MDEDDKLPEGRKPLPNEWFVDRANQFSGIKPMTDEERNRANERAAANSDNVIELDIPTPEDRELMTMEQQVYEDFGDNGLFTVQIMSAAVHGLMEEIDKINARIDSLSKK
jgi:hypothetical protein